MRRLLLFLFLMASIILRAEKIFVDGIFYNIYEDYKNAAVTTYRKGHYSGDIVIPNMIEYGGVTYKVTSIEDEAFKSSDIATIKMPNSLVYIGKQAFRGTKITSVEIPKGVQKIDKFAFAECKNLQSVTIPSSVRVIGARSFYKCPLTSLDIPNGVLSIGESAFTYCTMLKSVSIGESVVRIDTAAFRGCSLLENVTIPQNVLYIGYDAFNTKIKTVVSKIENLEIVTMGDNSDYTTLLFGDEATIYVPKGTKGKYASNKHWKRYKIVEGNGPTDGVSTTRVKGSNCNISSDDGIIKIGGIADGNTISVYTISGKLVESKKSFGKQTTINTNLNKGEIAIIKIGEETFKIIID